MKKSLFFFMCLMMGVAGSGTPLFAQNVENPYVIFGINPYIAGSQPGQEDEKKVFVIDNLPESSAISRVEHHTETGIISLFDRDGNLLEEKKLSKGERGFLSIDPKAEKYYSVSPYAYALNNPIRFIDPNGTDVWELDHNGRVKWIDKSEVHTLYALNADGQRTGNSITLKNRAVFDNLTKTGFDSEYTASYSHGNPSELASVFLFAADNSNAEWRFSRFDHGNGDQYALGTVHRDDLSISTGQMGFVQEAEVAFIHSHPTARKNATDEWESMGWRILPYAEIKGSAGLKGDSKNVKEYNYRSFNNYLTYFPHSGNIYRVRGERHPAFIRNIKNHNNNPKHLFWGTLNAR